MQTIARCPPTKEASTWTSRARAPPCTRQAYPATRGTATELERGLHETADGQRSVLSARSRHARQWSTSAVRRRVSNLVHARQLYRQSLSKYDYRCAVLCVGSTFDIIFIRWVVLVFLLWTSAEMFFALSETKPDFQLALLFYVDS